VTKQWYGASLLMARSARNNLQNEIEKESADKKGTAPLSTRGRLVPSFDIKGIPLGGADGH
jgi:hypothetical protein